MAKLADKNAEAALGQRKGQGRAVQPSARDQDVGVPGHPLFLARRDGLSMRRQAASVAENGGRKDG